MVLITYKKSEKNSFTISCGADTKVSHILTAIIESIHLFITVNNLRVYLDRLIWSVDELANKGVLKPP